MTVPAVVALDSGFPNIEILQLYASPYYYYGTRLGVKTLFCLRSRTVLPELFSKRFSSYLPIEN